MKQFPKYKKSHPKARFHGAPTPKEFEHIYQTIVNIPIRQVREVFRVYCKYLQKEEEITKFLSPKQLVLYGFKEEL